MKRVSLLMMVVLCSSLAGVQNAHADVTGTLLPVSEGTNLQWTPSTGATHYTLVDESTCNGTTDYNRTTTVGHRDAYGLSLSSVPDGSTITGISITPCASRNSGAGGSSTMKVFYRFDGTISADYGSYALTGTNPTALSTTNITSLTHVKSATSTLEIGALYSAGNRGARLSHIAASVTYTPLAAPSALSATTISSTQINVAWTDNSSNETGFAIERSTDGGAYSQIATVGPNVTTYSDTTVTADHVYDYRVRSYNTGGNSAYSNVATAKTIPAAPSSLGATTISATQINLLWTDNAIAEEGFKIERSTNGSAYSQIATVGANVTTYSDTTVTENNEYSYRVRAYNSAGNSSYSNAASAHTYMSAPVAPTSLSVTNSGITLVLNWTDNATNEKQYKIERQHGTGTFVQIATRPANTTTYVDGAVLSGITYTYRVRANNPAGDSAYSNEASGTRP